MANVTKPNTFSSGNTISPSEVNDNFDTLYNEFNGSIEAANLAAGSITTVKLANTAVTTAKLADGSVTADKLTANTLEDTYSNNSPGTSRASSLSVTVTAGTWLILAQGWTDFSVAQNTTHTLYLENQTDTTDLALTVNKVDYNGSTINADFGWSLMDLFVAADTKVISLDEKVNTTSGATSSRDGKLIAVQIGT